MLASDLIISFFKWAEDLLRSFSDVWGWLNSPLIEFDGWTFTPLSVLGFAGIGAILVYCLVKWVIPI